jgi:hypothetical protein
MKKSKSRLSAIKEKIFILVMVFELISLALTAQDAGILEINSPQTQVYMNQEVEFSATIANLGEVPLFEGVTIFEVFHEGNLIFEVYLPVTILNPGEQIIINSYPEIWVPFTLGIYTLRAEILFSNDDNPFNNLMEMDFFVDPPIVDHEVFQVNMINPFPMPNSLYGIFRIHYVNNEFMTYANVMAMNPLDGNIAWIVKNLPLAPHYEPQTLDYWFDFGQLGFMEGMEITDIGLSVITTPEIMTDGFPVELWPIQPVFDYTYDVYINNLTESEILAPPTDINYITYTPITFFDFEFRDCEVPNIDLDNGAHPASPDYAGDHNACGPAAAANSMKWLENTHPDIPNTGTTLRGAMESMSGHMDRGNGAGVTTTQLVKGKLGYIDEHQLPIHVKYQSWWLQNESIASPNPLYGHEAENQGSTSAQKPPTWEFFKQEMDKGEDVEILFGWYDANGNRHGGHWVTASGYYQDDNTRGIYIKDDGDQSAPGGTSQSYHDWIKQDDWGRLGGYDGPNGYCWIESVVSESYDPMVTHSIFDLLLERVVFIEENFEPYDRFASFTFSFPPLDYPRFLNVRASVPDIGQEEWVLRNILLPPFYNIDQFSTWFDLKLIGVEDLTVLDEINLEVSVTEELILDAAFDITFEVDLPIVESEMDVGDGSEGEAEIEEYVIDPQFPVHNPDSVTTYVYRGCAVPNIDLDSTGHPASDTYAGDRNACVPASAANSMHWLENTYPDSIPSTNTTLREKLEELSGLMNRPDNQGVHRNNFAFIQAKLAFIDAHELPIHVKFQGLVFDLADIASPNANWNHTAENHNTIPRQMPSWEFLKQEMEAGEDVELVYGKYVDGARRGGHSVTVTGINESGGVRRIAYKHDRSQTVEDSTRLRQEVVTWQPHESGNGHVYFPEFSGGNRGYFVESIISESYDSTINHPNALKEIDENPFKVKVINNPGSIYDPVRIEFELPESRFVDVKIFDMRGKEMFEKRLGYLYEGRHKFELYAEGLRSVGNYVLVLFAEDRTSNLIFVRM